MHSDRKRTCTTIPAASVSIIAALGVATFHPQAPVNKEPWREGGGLPDKSSHASLPGTPCHALDQRTIVFYRTMGIKSMCIGTSMGVVISREHVFYLFLSVLQQEHRIIDCRITHDKSSIQTDRQRQTDRLLVDGNVQPQGEKRNSSWCERTMGGLSMAVVGYI
jgi:hypothetical protein